MVREENLFIGNLIKIIPLTTIDFFLIYILYYKDRIKFVSGYRRVFCLESAVLEVLHSRGKINVGMGILI